MRAAAFENHPIATAIAAEDGRYLDVNQAFCAFTGFSRDELIGKTSAELGLVPAEVRKGNLREAASGEGTKSLFVAVRRRDGFVMQVLSKVERISLAGRTRFIAASTDVSDWADALRRAATAKAKSSQELADRSEDLARKNMALGEVLARIAEDKLRIKEELASGLDDILPPLLNRLKAHKEFRKLASMTERRIRSLTRLLAPAPNLRRLRALSRREREIVEMIRESLSTKEIASILNISPQTIGAHRRSIRRKLGLRNRKVAISSVFEDTSAYGHQP